MDHCHISVQTKFYKKIPHLMNNIQASERN